MKKKLTYNQWKEIGDQCLITRNEVFNLYDMLEGVLDKKDTKHLFASVNKLLIFMGEIQYIMFDKHDVQDFKIFGGPREDDPVTISDELTHTDWLEIGKQTKKTRIEIFKFAGMIWPVLTKVESRRMKSLIGSFDSFRSEIEDIMLDEYRVGDINVFYGGC